VSTAVLRAVLHCFCSAALRPEFAPPYCVLCQTAPSLLRALLNCFALLHAVLAPSCCVKLVQTVLRCCALSKKGHSLLCAVHNCPSLLRAVPNWSKMSCTAVQWSKPPLSAVRCPQLCAVPAGRRNIVLSHLLKEKAPTPTTTLPCVLLRIRQFVTGPQN
jgi:hypothetical protein